MLAWQLTKRRYRKNRGCKRQPYVLSLWQKMGRHRNTKFDKAYADYLSGLSLEQVAETLSVTRQCVYKAFKKRGLQLRGPNFKPSQEFDGKKFTLRATGYYSLSVSDRCLMHRYVWEYFNGPIPDNFDVHHKDENKSNNDISNLEIMTKSDHTKLHGFKNNQYTIKCR